VVIVFSFAGFISVGELAKFPGVKVLDGLIDLADAVHNERSVVH